MSFLTALSPDAASKLVLAVALGALTTAGAGAGAATLLTGSPNPSTWLQTYQHVSECHQPGAEQDPSCSNAAAQANFELSLAAGLENEAKKLTAGAGTSPSPDPVQTVETANPEPVRSTSAPAMSGPELEPENSGGTDD